MKSKYKFEFMDIYFKNGREYHKFLTRKERYIKALKRFVDYHKSKHSITSIIESLQGKEFRENYWITRFKHRSWFIEEPEE